MDNVNLDIIYISDNNDRYKLSEKLLMLPIERLVTILLSEMEAKNEAYSFIIKKGLMDEFNKQE